MNHIDLVIGGTFLFSVLIGAVRGFTREFLSLFSWASSGFLTYLTYPVVQSILKQKIQNPMLADVLSGVATFACFLLLFGLFSHLLANWIQNSFLGGLDRSLGLLFGFVRGALLLCIAEMIVSCFISRAQYPHTALTPYVIKGSDTLLNALPAHLKAFLLESQKGPMDKVTDAAQTVKRLAQLQTKIVSDEENSSPIRKNAGQINRLLSTIDSRSSEDPKAKEESEDKKKEKLLEEKEKKSGEGAKEQPKKASDDDQHLIQELLDEKADEE